MSENTTTSYEEGVFPLDSPDAKISVKEVFGIDMEMEVPAFSQANDYVPAKDEAYRFDRDTTLAILAGFAHNRRVMIQGYHGTGKSTHIEQVASRLNWPCIGSTWTVILAGSTWWAKTPLCYKTVNKSQPSRKAFFPGACKIGSTSF